MGRSISIQFSCSTGYVAVWLENILLNTILLGGTRTAVVGNYYWDSGNSIKLRYNVLHLSLKCLLVPKVGIEPTLHCCNQILSLARLPIPPLRQLLFNIKPISTIFKSNALFCQIFVRLSRYK